MTNNPIAPPPRKKKKKTKKPPSFSSIPDDVIVNILARISRSYYRSLCLVSKHFNSLLSSPDIHAARSLIGNTDARLYVCLWLPPTPSSIHQHSWFTLGYRQGGLSLIPVRLSSSYSPDRLNSTTVAVHSEIYQIGGSNEDKRTRAVRVLDCQSRTWRFAPDMMVARKHARSYFLDDRIYVIGGCTRTEETMSWGEVFDLKTQTWKPLPKLPCADYVHGAVFGERLHVFTINSYKNYAYDSKEERWVQEAGFVGLGRITGPWCVIGNEIYAEHEGKYTWYDPRNGKQVMIYGLKDVYAERANSYRTIQLVNHGGKLVIIWDEWHRTQGEHKSVWYAVISLEKHETSLGTRMRGRVERCNVVLDLVHKSYKLSSCLSVSV